MHDLISTVDLISRNKVLPVLEGGRARAGGCCVEISFISGSSILLNRFNTLFPEISSSVEISPPLKLGNRPNFHDVKTYTRTRKRCLRESILYLGSFESRGINSLFGNQLALLPIVSQIQRGRIREGQKETPHVEGWESSLILSMLAFIQATRDSGTRICLDRSGFGLRPPPGLRLRGGITSGLPLRDFISQVRHCRFINGHLRSFPIFLTVVGNVFVHTRSVGSMPERQLNFKHVFKLLKCVLSDVGYDSVFHALIIAPELTDTKDQGAKLVFILAILGPSELRESGTVVRDPVFVSRPIGEGPQIIRNGQLHARTR